MNFVVLDEVAKIDRTVASDKDCQILPYVGLEHIEKDTGHFSNDFKRESETLLASKFKFSSSHVLYGKLRPYLNKVALPSFEGVCTTEILPILPNSKLLDRRYLWLIFLSPKFVAWASKSVSGANLPRLDPKELAQYQIPLPSLEEQQRIAQIASKCDRLRRTRRYTQQLSDTYLQSVFLEMFGDPVTNTKDWESSLLESKITFITSGSRGWANFYAESGDIFLRIQNIGKNRLILNDLTYVQAPNTAETQRTKVKSGDILVSITADLGRIAVIPSNFPKAFINQHLALVRTEDINPIFLASYLNSEGGKKQFENLDRGGVKSGLNFDNIRSLKIILPSLPLQEKFAQTVQRFECLRAQQRESDRQAEHLFQSILHRAFQGEL
jgi:type I restriction enzyme, S subunit